MNRFSDRSSHPCISFVTLTGVLAFAILPLVPSASHRMDDVAMNVRDTVSTRQSMAVPAGEARSREWVVAANSACNPRVAVCE